MLSSEEREGLLAEGADPRRREVLARHRPVLLAEDSPAGVLGFLTAAAALLAPLASLPRRRPRAGGRFLL